MVKYKIPINQVPKTGIKHCGDSTVSEITSGGVGMGMRTGFMFGANAGGYKALLTPYGQVSSCLVVRSWTFILNGDSLSMKCMKCFSRGPI